MKFAYVLPEPGSYPAWTEFDADLRALRRYGYDAVELQIADPAALDEARLRASLAKVGFPLCAFQTGGTYATRGNCLCTANAEIRSRTIALLKAFVGLAARFNAVIVFGSLQGQAVNEPDLAAGRRRIVKALAEICAQADARGVRLALEPINHLETAYHPTIAAAARLAREIGRRSARLMIDTFHMNIEETSMTAPIAGVADILAHVHLSETNRDVLGAGHLDTAAFLTALRRVGYQGFCSIGVYNTTHTRRECMRLCMQALRNKGGRSV
jgi:sugar phosphate isomerase/epimerase